MDLRALLLLVGLVGVRADDASAWDVKPPDAFCVLHGAHLCVGDYHTHVNQDETTFSVVALGRSTFAAPTFGDLDGDGDLDMVVGKDEGTQGSLQMFENVGTWYQPSFRRADAYEGFDLVLSLVLKNGKYPRPALADLDGDDILDLVVGVEDGTLYFFRGFMVPGVELPWFTAVVGWAPAGVTGEENAAPTLGDVDGDEVQDLIVGYAGAVHFHKNSGTKSAPSFDAASSYSFWDHADRWYAPALGDLDGDAVPELVVGIENPKDAKELPKIEFASQGSYSYGYEINANFPDDLTPAAYPAPALADLIGWGTPDLAIGSEHGDIEHFYLEGHRFFRETSSGSPTSKVSAEHVLGGGTYSAPALGDIDGDGDVDLVVGDVTGRLAYFQNNGTATEMRLIYAVELRESLDSCRGRSACGCSSNEFCNFDSGSYGTCESCASFSSREACGEDGLPSDGEDDCVACCFEAGAIEIPWFESGPFAYDSNHYMYIESKPLLVDLDNDADLDLVVGFTMYNECFDDEADFVAPDGTTLWGRGNGWCSSDLDEYVGQACTPAECWDLCVDAYGAESIFAIELNGIGGSCYCQSSCDCIEGGGWDQYLITRDTLESLPNECGAGTCTESGTACQAVWTYEGLSDCIDISGCAPTPCDGDESGPWCMPEGGGDYEWCYCTPGGDRRLEETDLAALKSGGARRLEEADLAALKYFENVGNATHPSFVLAADEVSPFRNITFAATGGSTAPAAADVDGDGDLDLVVGSSHTKLHYFVNRGTAEAPVFFRESEPASEDPFSSISPGEDAAPALADIDGDGDVDLVFGNELGTVGYFTNTGSSTRPTFELGHQFTFRLSMTIALADTDGDGDVDLVAGEAGGALMYFESVRDVRFFSTVPASADPVASVVFSPPLQPDAAPCFVDVDGDGDLDVLVIQEKGRLTYLENTGSATRPVLEVAGGHHPFSRLGVEAAWGLVRPAFADLDGDDDLDLVLGLADAGGWRYYKNEGNATHPNFADPEGSTPFADLEYPATFSPGDVPGAVSGATSPAFGDLDGDLDLDLVVGRDLTKDGAGGATGALFYSINAGDRASPKFGGLSSLATDLGTSPAPALVDFDGDADLDLFVGDAGDPPALPARVVYFERASGVNVSFAAGEATGVTFGSGSLLVPALGDLDGDGDPDLLVGDDRGALSFLVRGYCSPEGPCSNNGLCAGAAETFNEVSCECLVGFSGDQCDQCQGGYFGPACDVCPEGGDEERSRPRITDTCGVKNSGRSRGTCDDAVTGSGACACFPPFYGPGCEQGECPAGSLEVAESNGIFYFSACDDCAPGTYSSAGDAQCAACDAGKYSGSGASACADCAPGTYSGAGTAACLPCAARSYAKAAGATSCVFAEPGSFVNETGASEQTACPAGTYSGSGAAACSDCEPGTYQDATGRPSCKRADGGSFVDADGASEQKPCAAGTYSSSGAETCSDCEPGRYTDGVGESSCALADAGFFVRETGASEQTACPAGYFSGSGASECLPCQPGTFADEGGAASCQLSNAGSFVASAGATAEVACAPGRYSGAGASYCALCPVGATNDGGEATCTTVDAGSMAPLPVEFRLTIQSSVLLDGVDADAFNADAPANKQLTTALNASLVVDLFTTVIIDSAAIVSVGPAAATAHGSTAIAFDVAVHYSASASESIESMKELILEDFDVDLLDKVKDGTLQNAIDAAVSSSARFFRRSASVSALSGATVVSKEIFEANVAPATMETEQLTEQTFEGTLKCPAGTSSSSGASACEACSPGKYTRAEGANICELASAGHFVADAGATAEEACAPGKISPGGGSSACYNCEPGAYRGESGETSCQLSKGGFYVEHSGASSETACPAGKYSASGATSCAACEAGRYSESGADTCLLAVAGYFCADAGASAEVPCKAGSYSGAAASKCTPCAEGSYASKQGSATCTAASAGSFVAKPGATSEVRCEPGERSGVGQSKCEQCQPGTYASDAGSTTCDLCEAGTFAEESGKSACDECPAGKYAAAAGSTMCSIANAGSYTSKKGSSEQATCKAGTISGPEQSECTKCPAGSFAAEDGLSSCTLANAGYVVAADGASRQEPCDAGTISGAGQSSCDKCEPGTFASKQGSTTCSLANAGSYVAEEGATNQQDCAPGTFSSGAGQSSCDPSPPGSYVPRSGEVAAVIADAGYVVEEEGASEQTECRAGSYSGAKASACEPCEPGRYANLEAAATCEAAPPGTFAWIRGAVEPSTCPAGRFSGSGAVSCALCPDGQTSEAGSATCRPVDAGSTNAELSTVTFEIESGLVLDGLDVDRFSGDDAARRAFAAAIYEIVSAGGIVYDVSAEDVHLSAGRRRLDATADESTEVRFVARTVYTLVPGEDVVDDAFKRYIESLYIQGVQSPLLASIASGDAQRALDNRTAGTSIASAVIDAASSAALVAGETGVAVSEARATTDALVVACPPGTYSTSGAASCTPCQPGSYTELAGQTDCKFAEPGFFVAAAGASAQAPCPAGTDSTSAAVACSPCRAGYYSDRTGQPECERCETPTTTLDEGKTSCDACIDDYYRDGALDEALAATGSAALECTECCVKCDDLCTASDDDCAKCPAGTTIATVDARKNFWRTSAAATHLYRCDRQGACEGGANSTCARGHKGVRCGTCEAGYYYDSARNRCQHCGDKFDLSGDNIVGTCLVVAFALLFYAALHQRYGWKTIKSYVVAFFKEFDALDVYSDSRRRKHVDGNAAEREAVSDKRARSAPAGGDGAANDGEAPHRPRSSVMTKFKIVVATYQIATSIPWSLPQVRLPAALEQAMKLGSIVNLSLISFSKAECFGDVTYFHKLLFTTLFPAAVVALILAVALRRGPRMGGEERSRALAGALYWVCFALFIFVPGTSSYVFRYFSCAGYEGYGGETDLRVMRIDPTISCDSPGYDAWLPYVVLAVLAYPVGVPLGFACVLYRRRRHINPPIPRRKTRADAGGDAVAAVDRRLFPHLDNEEDLDFLDAAIERHRAALETLEKLDRRAEDPALGPVRFLYEEFRPECYGFIVFEVTRRIFLTGCLTMFLDGSISQIAVGLLGTMISYRVGNYYRPYVEEDDNIVFEIANTQLVLFFFYCVMVYATENLEEHDGVFSGKIFGICLILLLVSILVVAVWLVVVSHFGSAGVGRFFSLAKDRQRRRASLNSALAALNSLTSFSFRKPKPAGDEEPVDAGDVAASDVAVSDVAVDDAAIPNLGRMAPPRLRERDPDPKPRGSA